LRPKFKPHMTYQTPYIGACDQNSRQCNNNIIYISDFGQTLSHITLIKQQHIITLA